MNETSNPNPTSRDEAGALSRRGFLQGAFGVAVATGVGLPLAGCATGARPRDGTNISSTPRPPSVAVSPDAPADVKLHIGPAMVELAEGRIISTTAYNGGVPGPLIRLREGKPVVVQITNDTDTPELVHWHGQFIPPAIDGAAEENSLFVPAHGQLRYRMTPGPRGMRFVHTHITSMSDLHRGTYTGQHAPVYIEPADDPGRYDQEVFLTTHEWEPFFTHAEEEGEAGGEQHRNQHREEKAQKEQRPNGWEVGYRLFSINGKALGHGEPIRVRRGRRVLFHFLNGSATENIHLALPGHRFRVVALDGNPVPHPAEVDVLQLGTAERIDATVEMNHPGVWVLGTPRDDDRQNGLGVVVEYADQTGPPQWSAPPQSKWDYTLFGNTPTASHAATQPDQTIPMVFGKINRGTPDGFNVWTVNGQPYQNQGPPMKLARGHRYRLAFENRTDEAHPLHLHRNSFELTRIHGKPTAGILKDVVLIPPFGKIDADFTANHPGLTLFHCHQQLHMDYGFMRVFDVG